MVDKKNINEATFDDLKKINGLEDKKITNVLEYIEDHNPVMNISELTNVNGISTNIIEELSSFFYAGAEQSE